MRSFFRIDQTLRKFLLWRGNIFAENFILSFQHSSCCKIKECNNCEGDQHS